MPVETASPAPEQPEQLHLEFDEVEPSVEDVATRFNAIQQEKTGSDEENPLFTQPNVKKIVGLVTEIEKALHEQDAKALRDAVGSMEHNLTFMKKRLAEGEFNPAQYQAIQELLNSAVKTAEQESFYKSAIVDDDETELTSFAEVVMGEKIPGYIGSEEEPKPRRRIVAVILEDSDTPAEASTDEESLPAFSVENAASLAAAAFDAKEAGDADRYARIMNLIKDGVQGMIDWSDASDDSIAELIENINGMIGEGSDEFPLLTSVEREPATTEVLGEDEIHALAVEAYAAKSAGNKDEYARIMVKILSALDALKASDDYDEAKLAEFIANLNSDTLGEESDDYPLIPVPELDSDEPEVEEAQRYMDSVEFKEKAQLYVKEVETARSELAKASADLRMKLFSRGKKQAAFDVASAKYQAALTELSAHLRLGWLKDNGEASDTKEQFNQMIIQGLVEEKRSAAEQEWEILGKKKFSKFLDWYAKQGKAKRFAVGATFGIAAGAAGFLTGGIAAFGVAPVLAARFTKRFVRSAGKEGFDQMAEKDMHDFTIKLNEIGANPEAYGLVQSIMEQRIKADQKRMRRAVGAGLAGVAVGSAIGGTISAIKGWNNLDNSFYTAVTRQEGYRGYPMGAFEGNASAEFESNLAERAAFQAGYDQAREAAFEQYEDALADAREQVADATAARAAEEATQQAAEQAAEEAAMQTAEEAAAAVEEVAPVVEDFVDTVNPGDGITNTLADLARAEGIDGLNGSDLYQIYNQFESDFAKLDNVYDMGNGDYGIASPGEFRIPAELREQIVNEMHGRVGNTVSTTAEAASDALEGTLGFVDEHVAGESVKNTLSDYAESKGINLTDAQVDDMWNDIVAQYGSGTRQYWFPGSNGYEYTSAGQGGIRQDGLRFIDEYFQSENLVNQ